MGDEYFLYLKGVIILMVNYLNNFINEDLPKDEMSNFNEPYGQ